MKKIIIASLVGGILLFGWQGLSWMVMGIHDKEYLYTPAQDNILTTLKGSLTEEGQYSIPNVPAGSSQKQMEELGKSMEGKAWATVTYHKAYKMDMTMQIIRGFLISLVCVWLCCLVIGKQAEKTLVSGFSTALTFGLVSFLFVWYIGHNWGGTPWSILKPHLIDDLVGWGITGIWLGWWYSRK